MNLFLVELLTGCLLILCLTTSAEDAAAPNRNGVNCVLAPPDAGNQASQSSDSSSAASDHTQSGKQSQASSSDGAGAGAHNSGSQSSSAKLLSGKKTNSKSTSSAAGAAASGQADGSSDSASGQAENSGQNSAVSKGGATVGSAKKSSQGSSSAQILDATASDAAAAKVTAKRRRRTSKASSTSASSSSDQGGSSGAGGADSSASKKASHEIKGAILVADDGSENFGTKFDSSKWLERSEKNDQGNVWTELNSLRGKDIMSAGEIQDILNKAVPGKDYPTYGSIPTTSFKCENVHQAGFYADPEARCQVIRRCDINAIKWNYLCPNATLFNQITLTCDWYFNIDCSQAVKYYDYSNSRLYHSDWLLLDTPPETQA